MTFYAKRDGFKTPDYHPVEDDRPIVAKSIDWPQHFEQSAHYHKVGQLVFASSGILDVIAEEGAWVTPSQRAVWIPAGTVHAIFSKTKVELRTIYIDENTISGLPQTCSVLQVSPLLRALLLEAMHIPKLYEQNSRDGRVMGLIIDEILRADVRTADFHLPLPKDRRVQAIVETILHDPGDERSLQDWSRRVGASGRTIQRIFLLETGLQFSVWKRQAILLASLRALSEGKTILEIALDLGYASPSAFTYMFRKSFGVTPSQFLK